MSIAPRRTHWMRPNHGTETPSNLLFVDVAHHEIVHRVKPRSVCRTFRLICSTHVVVRSGEQRSRVEMVHRSLEDWWDYVETCQSARDPLHIYAHDLGIDLTLLEFWHLLESRRYRAGLTTVEESGGVLRGDKPYRGKLCVDGHPFFVYALGRRGICKFVDVMNYFGCGIDHLGDSIGIPRQTFPGVAASDSVMAEYCQQDVRIVEAAMIQMMARWRKEDCGIWQPTAAMLSMTSFRHRLPVALEGRQPRTILMDSKDDWVPLERAAYYGGQTTAWYVGPIAAWDDPSNLATVIPTGPETERPVGPLYHLDVRSLYPSVMERNLYPFKRLFSRSTPSVRDVEKWLSGYGVCAWVDIDHPTEEHTTRIGVRQYQCTGRFTTALCGPELLRAITTGSVSKVHSCQVYCMDELFRPWVDHWCGMRQIAIESGDKFTEEYVKLVLNSLTGKFAQSGDRWVDVPDKTPLVDWGHWYDAPVGDAAPRQYRGIAGMRQEHVQGREPWYSFPVISAYICAYGREQMRWLRHRCPERSVLYQATDSLIVTQSGYDALVAAGLVRDGQLGYLRLIGCANDGHIYGCNDYRLGELSVRSGAWGRAIKKTDGTYTFEANPGTESILQTRPDGRVQIDEIVLPGHAGYTKGTRLPGGWVTWPNLPDNAPPF